MGPGHHHPSSRCLQCNGFPPGPISPCLCPSSQFSIWTQITGHSKSLVCCKPPRGPISLTVEAKVTEQPAGLLWFVPVGCLASSPDTLFSVSHPSHTGLMAVLEQSRHCLCQGQHIAIPLSGTFYPVHSTFPYHDAFVLCVCVGGSLSPLLKTEPLPPPALPYTPYPVSALFFSMALVTIQQRLCLLLCSLLPVLST